MAIHKFMMLYKDLKDTLGESEADRFFPEYIGLTDKMSAKEQFLLAKKIMDRMDETLDETTIRKIRHGHSCNLTKEQIQTIKELKEKCDTLEEFLIAYGCIKKDVNTFWAPCHFTKCPCGFFRRLEDYEPMSKTWCECCNGHTIKSFSRMCGVEVESRIVELIVSGGKDCIFEITVPARAVEA